MPDFIDTLVAVFLFLLFIVFPIFLQNNSTRKRGIQYELNSVLKENQKLTDELRKIQLENESLLFQFEDLNKLKLENQSLHSRIDELLKELESTKSTSAPSIQETSQEPASTLQIEPPQKPSEIDMIRSQPHVIALESKLQQYMNRLKNEAEIGKEFERYVGYKYEMQGCLVEYRGIQQGYHDLGCDLLVKTSTGFIIVQCKCWKKRSVVHEKYILQLHGTVSLYKKNHPEASVFGILVTTASLSSDAKNYAERLGIRYQEKFDFEEHPMVKCITIGYKRKYYLPCDPTYDKIYFSLNQGDCYVESVAEAELLGFHH